MFTFFSSLFSIFLVFGNNNNFFIVEDLCNILVNTLKCELLEYCEIHCQSIFSETCTYTAHISSIYFNILKIINRKEKPFFKRKRNDKKSMSIT